MVTRARVGGTVGARLPFVCRAWMTNVQWDLTYTDPGRWIVTANDAVRTAAAWSFHAEGDPAADAWVRVHAQAVLAGGATRVAGNLRRAATRAGLEPAQRANADTCARYLTNKRAHLDYPTALKEGWPIATGIIEGACRHLVKDRMDLTGAHWGLHGAAAILKLRALRCNGDFETYWRYHLGQEQRRVQQTRYADNLIPKPHEVPSEEPHPNHLGRLR